MKKFENDTTEADEQQSLLDNLIRAAAIAKQVFGAASVYAAGEIADYLEDASEEAEKQFSEDLQRAVEHAGLVFETEKPTAEQTFFCLERVILADVD